MKYSVTVVDSQLKSYTVELTKQQVIDLLDNDNLISILIMRVDK